jgi:hypothetical protein
MPVMMSRAGSRWWNHAQKLWRDTLALPPGFIDKII